MADRRAPVNGPPHGTISWEEHLKAWEAYHRSHSEQSADRIAERGGFGIAELVTQLGYMPITWEPDRRTRFMRGVSFQPFPGLLDREPKEETPKEDDGPAGG